MNYVRRFILAETGAHLTAGGQLPRDGVLSEFAERRGVHDGEEPQIDAHKQVGHAEVAHEEARHVHFRAGEHQDEHDGAVAEQGH